MSNSIPGEERRIQVDRLLVQLENGGLEGLSADERGILANVVLSDPRSACLLPIDLSSEAQRRQLCDAVRRAWLEEEWHIVLDYRQRLRNVIGRIQEPEYPIAALILYATWVEHTLNGILIRQGLLRGLDANQVEAMVRDAKFDSKIGWLRVVLGLPDFDPTHRGRLIRLNEARNQYVHYKWKGYPQAAHEAQLRDLRNAVANIETTIDYLLAYYEENLIEPYVRDALVTFEISKDILAQNA